MVPHPCILRFTLDVANLFKIHVPFISWRTIYRYHGQRKEGSILFNNGLSRKRCPIFEFFALYLNIRNMYLVFLNKIVSQTDVRVDCVLFLSFLLYWYIRNIHNQINEQNNYIRV